MPKEARKNNGRNTKQWYAMRARLQREGKWKERGSTDNNAPTNTTNTASDDELLDLERQATGATTGEYYPQHPSKLTNTFINLLIISY